MSILLSRVLRRLFLVLWLSTCLVVPDVHSQEPVGQSEAAPSDNLPIDVLLVLDDSGSMATCWPWGDDPVRRTDDCARYGQSAPSDLASLRYSAAKLLVQLADDDDRIMVIRFDSTVEAVGATAFQRVGGPDSRRQIISSLNPPASYDQRGYTRIDLGLAEAVKIFHTQGSAERQRYVLFLTDGTPTHPQKVPQDTAIADSASQLGALGVQIFPVALCSPDNTACPKAFLERLLGATQEARQAQDLLRVFSEIFTRMKPTLHIVDYANGQNGDGDLELQIRQVHGARQLNVVTTRDGFSALLRDGSPQSPQLALQDGNIAVHSIESSVLPDGRWTVKAQENTSFVVAKTETYPRLIHPVPSVPGSASAPRYVPRGKAPLILASTFGPGAGEPLIYNGTTPLQSLTPDKTAFWTALPTEDRAFTIQVGNDTQPLQIKREFQLTARDNLPTAQTSLPACVPETDCLLTVDFSPGAEIVDPQGAVYVVEQQEGAGGVTETPVYAKPMTCAQRQCSDQGFRAEEGHVYKIRYLVNASSGGVRYSDWAEVDLAMQPAIYVRGLTTPLNIVDQPENGWPVTIISRTTEDLGRLTATLQLTRKEDGGAITTMSSPFSVDIRGAGEQQSTLRIIGGDTLRPGTYEGTLEFSVENQPSGEQVKLPAPVPISFTLSKPTATIDLQDLDFGQVPFDPAVTFRVDQTLPVTVTFTGATFPISATLTTSSCDELSLSTNLKADPASRSAQLELRLQSDVPIQPKTCKGQIDLTPAVPNPGDYDLLPAIPRTWQIKIIPIGWELLGFEQDGQIVDTLTFPDIVEAGQEHPATLIIDYTGPPGFLLDSLDFTELSEGLKDGDLTLRTSTAQPIKDQPNRYRVPVWLVAQQSPAHGPIRGWWHHGVIPLRISQLPSQPAQNVSFSFYAPSWPDRYIFPPILTVVGLYKLWLPGACIWPLTIVPIFLFTRYRKAAKVRAVAAANSQQNPPQQDDPIPAPPPPPIWRDPRGSGPIMGQPPGGMYKGRPGAPPKPPTKPAAGGPKRPNPAPPGDQPPVRSPGKAPLKPVSGPKGAPRPKQPLSKPPRR